MHYMLEIAVRVYYTYASSMMLSSSPLLSYSTA